MGKEILMFGNIEIDFFFFFFFWDIDIEKVLVSNKIPFGKKNYKYFIGYLYNGNKVNPLNVMYFMTHVFKLLEIYNTISDKISADVNKEFDSDPVYNKKYLKTKIKSNGDDVTDFLDKKFLS